MCDPVTLGLMVAGTAASAAGSSISQSDALQNAQNQANAANAILEQSLAKQQGYSNQTEGIFGDLLKNYGVSSTTPTTNSSSSSASPGGEFQADVDSVLPGLAPSGGSAPTPTRSYSSTVDPSVQAQQLASAQGSRAAADVGNISQPTVTAPANAPAAETQDLAKRMGAVLDYATTNAKNQANLSGYGDTWLENQLANAAANRNMAPIEAESQLEASLLPQEQQTAQTGAYTTPSMLGPLLQGAGNIAASAGGSMAKGVPSYTPTVPNVAAQVT